MRTVAETGYFGVPGTSRYTNVHAVDVNNVGICGYKAAPGYVFMWNAHGLYLPYVECCECRRRIEREIENTLAKPVQGHRHFGRDGLLSGPGMGNKRGNRNPNRTVQGFPGTAASRNAIPRQSANRHGTY